MRDRGEVIQKAAEQMAENYRKAEVSMYGNHLRMPERKKIVEIIRDLQKLIFPAYFGEKKFLALPPEQYGVLLMNQIYDTLQKQIALALEEDEGRQQDATEICNRFFEQLPEIQQMLMKDMQAEFDGDPAASSREEVICAYPGLFAIFVYRVAHALEQLKVPMIPRIMTEYAHCETGIDIHPGATIGEYFCIDHGTGIVIGETTIIGDWVKMYQGATLGALSTRDARKHTHDRRHPTVGDHVTIYAGATILGGETTIGENTTIGGNTFLTESVGKNTRVTIKKPEMSFVDTGK